MASWVGEELGALGTERKKGVVTKVDLEGLPQGAESLWLLPLLLERSRGQKGPSSQGLRANLPQTSETRLGVLFASHLGALQPCSLPTANFSNDCFPRPHPKPYIL